MANDRENSIRSRWNGWASTLAALILGAEPEHDSPGPVEVAEGHDDDSHAGPAEDFPGWDAMILALMA